VPSCDPKGLHRHTPNDQFECEMSGDGEQILK
jgi:hypothetical protein